jgi:hypothetical protein
MLDQWLEAAYEIQTKQSAEFEIVGLLKDVPTLELKKLAAGTPAAELYAYMEKGGSSLDSPQCSSDEEKTWLSKFQGTPLFEQAVALETEMLEAEAAGIAQRIQEDSQPRPYQMQDQIRLKKRLLELELAKQNAGGTPPVAEPAQGAGAPGDVPPEGVQDNSQGLGGGVAKSAAAEMVLFADRTGRELARAEHEKRARVEVLLKVGSAAGAFMAKSALDLGAIGGMATKALGAAKPLASKALGMAASHPELAGAALGAGAGALAGGPDHRLSGALAGGALGAGAGHVGRNVAGGMVGGATMGQSAKGYAGSLVNKAKGLVGGAPPVAGA